MMTVGIARCPDDMALESADSQEVFRQWEEERRGKA